MGSLEVTLLRDRGNLLGEDTQTYIVKCAMPFFGYTAYEFMGENSAQAGSSTSDAFNDTQKSYGMWFVPPDVGVTVLVVFVDGDPSQGYWIGCVPSSFTNHMVPGIAGSTNIDLSQSDKKSFDTTGPLPVAEINRRVNAKSDQEINPEKIKKPLHPFAERLLEQGLHRDPHRGTTTSSARREAPSMVFGISTPGPLDKRAGAKKARVGTSSHQAQGFVSRLGGTQFVMDDGDEQFLRKTPASSGPPEYADVLAGQQGNPTIPKDECVRIRTRTGHQLLFHNSEDLIYIGNARGTAWIELTSNGKIDIYSNDSISISSGVDLNIYADRDINMTAARDFNINAGRDYKMTAVRDNDIKIGVNSKVDIGAQSDLYVGSDSLTFVGGILQLKVASDQRITTGGSLDLYTEETNRFTAGEDTDIKSGSANRFTAGTNTDILSGDNHTETAARIDMNGPAAASAKDAVKAATAELASPAPFPQRVPTAEPWDEHENLNPADFVPLRTTAITAPPAVLRNSSPLVNEEGDGAVTPGEANERANVVGPQVVVPGKVGLIGKQPAKPVAVNSMQRYFLSELIKGLGLNPATCLLSANALPTAGNAEALAMAMAQIQAECGFIPRSENLNYSADALRRVFPSRVRSDQFARELSAAGPASIANTLYGNRLGNAQDEGYKYRGRGLIQLTFKANYQTFGRAAGVPTIVDNPDLVNDPETATSVAVAYLKSKKITWSSPDLALLGTQFQKAVGYASASTETPKRIALAKGFLSKIIAGELTPLSKLPANPLAKTT
jgi:hypothetical protein